MAKAAEKADRSLDDVERVAQLAPAGVRWVSLAARTMISPLQVLISQLGEFKSSTDNFQIYIRTNPSLHVPAESGSAAKRWEMPPLPFNYYLDGLNNIYRTVIKH